MGASKPQNPPAPYKRSLVLQVPHDIYSPGSRRWRRKEVVAGSVAGEWIPSAEIKALLEDQYHSRCFVQGCHVHGPEASIDGDFGSFFAFPGTSGFVTYDLGKCFKVCGGGGEKRREGGRNIGREGGREGHRKGGREVR